MFKPLFLVVSVYAAVNVVHEFDCACCENVCSTVVSMTDLEACRLAIPETCTFSASFKLTLSDDDSICNRGELLDGTDVLSLNFNEVFEDDELEPYLKSIKNVTMFDLQKTECTAQFRSGVGLGCPLELGNLNIDFEFVTDPVGAKANVGLVYPNLVFFNDDDDECARMFRANEAPLVTLFGTISGSGTATTTTTFIAPEGSSFIEPPQGSSSIEPSQEWSSIEASQESSSIGPPQEWSSIEASQESSSIELPQEWSSMEASQESSSMEASQESTYIEPPQGSSSIEPPQESSSIEPPQESSSIEPPQESSSIEPPQGSSSIEPPQESSSIEPPQESSSIEPPQGSTTTTTTGITDTDSETVSRSTESPAEGVDSIFSMGVVIFIATFVF